MKNVLVLLHDDQGQEARLQAALDLTRALSGHLTCIDVVVPPAALSEYFTVDGGALIVEQIREREATNREAIEARLGQEDVPWSTCEAIGDPGRELRNAADLADIIVVSLPDEQTEGEFRRVLGEVAVNAGRPVLAVPSRSRGLDLAGPALVGWNGSHEASEALRQAVPLLQHAATVTILDVNNPAADFSVEEAASYLSRHGIHPEIVTQDSGGGPVSDIVLEKAHALGAAYVVLGAYGLPRPIEAIFGGVTAGLLRKSDLPLLLAH